MKKIITVFRTEKGLPNEGMRTAVRSLIAGRKDIQFKVISSTKENKPERNLADFVAFWMTTPFKILSLARHEGVVAIHFHCWLNLAVLPSLVVSTILSLRTIWTAYSPNAINRPLILHRWLLRLAERVIITNEACSDLLPIRLSPKIVLIPPAIDINRFGHVGSMTRAHARKDLGIKEDAIVLAYVGHILPGRNVERVLSAHATLIHVFPQRRVITYVASSGREMITTRRKLEALTDSLGIASDVVWEGFMDNIEVLLRATNVVLLPLETFGQVTLPPIICIESCMAGAFVLTTRFAGDLLRISPVLGGRILVSRDIRDFGSDLINAVKMSEAEMLDSSEAASIVKRWKSISLSRYDEVYGLRSGEESQDDELVAQSRGN